MDTLHSDVSRSHLLAQVLTRAALVALFVMAFALAFRQIDSVDIGLHLAPGRWILTHLSFPQQDFFTYTVSGNPYVDTYWLYQVVFAALDTLGGSVLLILGNAIALCAALFVLAQRCRGKVDVWSPNTLVILLVVVLTLNYEIRPHVISWLYLGTLLWILESGKFKGWIEITTLAAIMLLWVNTQPTFILGWLAIGCHLIRLVALEPRKVLRNFFRYVPTVVICFVNPYLDSGVGLPFTQFGFLRESNIFKHLIAEYNPLPFIPREEDYTFLGKLDIFRPMFMLQLFRIFLVAAIVFRLIRRKIGLHEFVLASLFFYVNTLAEKNIGYFIVAVAPLAIRPFSSSDSNISNRVLKEQDGTFSTRMRRYVYSPWGLTAVVSVLIVLYSLDTTLRLFTNDYYAVRKLHFRFGSGFNNLVLPVKATDFLVAQHLDGKILNHINFGGYLMYRIGPSRQIFADGRNEVTGEDFAEEYALTNNNATIGEVVKKYQPEISFFPHKEGLSWLDFFMHDTSHWRLVYFDELAAIYLRRDYAPEVPKVDASKILSSLSQLSQGKISDPFRRKTRTHFLDRYLELQCYPIEESEMAVFCYFNAWYSEAILFTLAAFNRSTVDCSELYLNLAVYYLAVGDAVKARVCLDRFEQAGYQSTTALEIRNLLARSNTMPQ